MKNAASCVKRCEMQDTPSTWFSNAYCSLGSFPGLRLSEGRYDIKIIIQVCMSSMPSYAVAILVRLIHTPDRVWLSKQLTLCVLSFSSLAITAEHYTFCWPLTTARCLIRGTYSLCCFGLVLERPAALELVNGGRPVKYLCVPHSNNFICRPQIKRDYPLNLSI